MAMEIGVFPLKMVDLSIEMLVYQRVYQRVFVQYFSPKMLEPPSSRMCVVF